MEIIVTISLSVLIIAFYFLFCFIDVLRKPLTAIVLFFVMSDVLTTISSSLNNIIVMVISGVVTALFLGLCMIKSKKTGRRNIVVSNFVFGICLTYISFYQLAVVGDAALDLFNKNSVVLTKLLNNSLPVDTLYITLASGAFLGILFAIFKKVFSIAVAAFVGGFVIILFAIDGFSGNMVNSLVLSFDVVKHPIRLLNSIVDKNNEMYLKTILDPDFIHVYIGLVFAVVASIVTAFIRKKELQIF